MGKQIIKRNFLILSFSSLPFEHIYSKRIVNGEKNGLVRIMCSSQRERPEEVYGTANIFVTTLAIECVKNRAKQSALDAQIILIIHYTL